MDATDPVEAWLGQWREELPSVLNSSSELIKRVMFFAEVLNGMMRSELADLGLTAAEFDVLVALRRAGAPYRLKPNQLARSLMLSTGGTTNVTHRLVSRELVEREGDPDDARSAWLRLTRQGVALAERAVLVNAAAHDALFESVPATAVDAATVALRDVFAACPALRGGDRRTRIA
ncbi:MarR family winged helix-turn-helix transcriptional regulator [Nocardia pseudovaccinii]|uniref:MarR family winged helix-turn-helix transcriptional regulator n=1 Tax=Nocardia pseudovaccinii TaxID=189540 RepID=UPI0007A40785|nr:MarR family transcriptional regulator [Nocardia pseudovaccinii]